jgi:hypothetical protein
MSYDVVISLQNTDKVFRTRRIIRIKFMKKIAAVRFLSCKKSLFSSLEETSHRSPAGKGKEKIWDA